MAFVEVFQRKKYVVLVCTVADDHWLVQKEHSLRQCKESVKSSKHSSWDLNPT